MTGNPWQRSFGVKVEKEEVAAQSLVDFVESARKAKMTDNKVEKEVKKGKYQNCHLVLKGSF